MVGAPSLVRIAILAAVLAPAGAAQVFVDDTGAVPQGSPFNSSETEEVDLADVDLDGDPDAAFADGGDSGNDQNRLWVNQGGAQLGTLGVFEDETATRFPAIQDESRDIEFADFEGDGDPDVFVSNSAQITNQTNRFWVNQGGAQGGSAGFYADETHLRWVGLGGPGSSIAPALVLASGGFIDWSLDSDFADFDDDGDVDLLQTSVASAFGGTVPSRIFLNDGDGFFSEFNPSGFQLPSASIADGDPAIWAEGLQMDDTTDVTGQFADVAAVVIDADVADVDGDLDVDILLGDRQSSPRMFANRLAQTGSLSFRDVTSAAIPAGLIQGTGHYEQELGDLDADGDLDLVGVNWTGVGVGLDDVTLENPGNGAFTNPVTLASSGDNDNEVDMLDYDNDGDLDLYFANFSGPDRLYENTDAGPGFGIDLVPEEVSGLGVTDQLHWDADATDVDGDGDPDVMTAAAPSFNPSQLLRNTLQAADLTPPSIPVVEALEDHAAAVGVRSVRAHVLDNAAYYVTGFNATELRVSVEGVDLPPFPMSHSGGQVFRGEIPANLVGDVVYAVASEDASGNAGASSEIGYVGTGVTAVPFGDASPGPMGDPTIASLSSPLEGATLYLAGGDSTPGAFGFLALSAGQFVPTLDLGDGLLASVGPTVFLLKAGVTDANGDLLLPIDLPAGTAGATIFAQYVAIDGAGATFASSQGLRIDIL